MYRICCIAFFLSAQVIADDVPVAAPSESSASAGYYLRVDESGAGSDELLRGDYHAAIAAALRSQRSGKSLSAYLTLCVAYMRIDALDDAAPACDGAVELARVSITTSRNPHGHRNRDGLAKAYLNRGVLLAMLGKFSAAQTEFERAFTQNRHREVIRHNMQVNQLSMATASTPLY